MSNRLASVERSLYITKGKSSSLNAHPRAYGLGTVFAFAKPISARAQKPWPQVSHPAKATFWAGPLATMINWKNKESESAAQVVKQIGAPAAPAFQTGRALTADELQDVFVQTGLVERPLSKNPEKTIEEMLLRFGPLLLLKNNLQKSTDGFIVVGIQGSGEAGASKLEIIDTQTGKGRRVPLQRVLNGARNLHVAHWHQDARLAGREAGSQGLSYTRAPSVAATVSAMNQSFDVRYDVQLVRQMTGMSCWAAGCAMLVGWRDQMSIDPSAIAAADGYWAQYKHGLAPEDTKIFKIWGLVPETPQTYTVEGFRRLLENYGPLWVASAEPTPHIRVVTGMYGDGTQENTQVLINDPWEKGMATFRPSNTGSKYTEKYSEFIRKQGNLGYQEMAVKAPIYVAHLPELPVWLIKMRTQGLSAYLPAVSAKAANLSRSAWKLDRVYGNISRATSFDATAPSSPGNPLVNCTKRNHYRNELQISAPVSLHSKGTEVKKVQEWLNLWRYASPDWSMTIGVDSDFGTETDNAVKAFQKMMGHKEDGVVDGTVFEMMTNPMRWAFTKIDQTTDLRELIVAYATEHVKSVAVELAYGGASNVGPWVRAYMLGRDGENYPWCMGFAQTILDLAFSTVGRDYSTLMPVSGSCDEIGKRGLTDGILIRNADLPARISEVKNGDLFLISKQPMDWTHAGLVTGVKGNSILTIEGNTNNEGSNNGYEVCSRSRDFKKQNLDIFKLSI